MSEITVTTPRWRPLYDPPSDWRPTPVRDLPSWAGAKRIAIDVETNDPKLRTLGIGVRRKGADRGYVVGVSFAIEDGPAHYLPVAHDAGDNLDPAHVWSYLIEQAWAYRGIVAGANLQYDLDYLAHNEVVFHDGVVFRDVQVAEPLLDELQFTYSLEDIAQRRGLPGKNEAHLREAADWWGLRPKADLWRLPARHVGVYAEDDTRLPLALLRRQEAEIDRQDLWGVYDLESAVLPVLTKMRRRGVRVDTDRLDQVERWCLGEEQSALEKVRHLSGVEVGVDDVWKTELVARALAVTGAKLPTTEKTGKTSVTSDVLKNIDHDVARWLRRARKINKVRTTFAASVREHLVDGRIHCSFHQLRNQREDGDPIGAAYGRLSSSDPNLQQQPARDPELGKMWREIYIPDHGLEWASADYSQQEPRMTVHFGCVARCTGAEEFAENYRRDPDADCYVLVAETARIDRKDAKAIFLGLCYGMGGAKLCRNLGLPTEWVVNPRTGRPEEVAGPEGLALMRTFHEAVPFVRELAHRTKNRAADVGFIRTLSGRRCRFPFSPKRGYEWTHKALNRLIQGSSADQTKMAMVELDRAGLEIQLQVHDEINMSVTDQAQADLVGEIMRNCLPLRVPSKVDVAVAGSWGGAL